jgi:hypothetical protein
VDVRIENPTNISNGVSTGWVRSTTQGVNEIWYTTSDNEAVTYNVDSETGNEVDSANSVAPADNDGVGIIRFTAPVTEIDSYGFYNLSNLASVTLPESVETIKAYAFRGCSSLSIVRVKVPTKQFGIYDNVFDQQTLDRATLIVPTGTIEQYSESLVFGMFRYRTEAFE